MTDTPRTATSSEESSTMIDTSDFGTDHDRDVLISHANATLKRALALIDAEDFEAASRALDEVWGLGSGGIEPDWSRFGGTMVGYLKDVTWALGCLVERHEDRL